jgi:DNA-binding beta-propeller fold protein YncE
LVNLTKDVTPIGQQTNLTVTVNELANRKQINMRKSLLAATLPVLLLTCAAAPGQYAGSNVTGMQGLIAVDKLGNKIRFYDPVTLAETSALDGPEKSAHELTVSYDHAKAYVPIYGDGIYGANPNPNNKIMIVDLVHRSIEGMVDLGDNLSPHGIAATRDGKLWVVCDRNNRLLLVDPLGKRIEASYDGNGKGAHFLAMLPDESKIYLSNKEAAMDVFDVMSRTFRPSIAIGKGAIRTGNGSGGESLVPSPDGKRLLVADNYENAIRIFDTTTDREIQTVQLRELALSNIKRSRLVKLLFSPDGKYLVVTSYAGGQAWVIDANDYSHQTMLPVAKGPQGIAFTADGRTALVSSQDSGLITRIDLRTGKAVGVSDGGVGIEVLAFY